MVLPELLCEARTILRMFAVENSFMFFLDLPVYCRGDHAYFKHFGELTPTFYYIKKNTTVKGFF